MLTDALKGAIPVVIAMMFLDRYGSLFGLAPVMAAIFVLIGHSKSIFLKFTGGKSVASGVGTILALNPIVGLSIAVIWGIITWFSKYVSLGSIIALMLSPVLMWLCKESIWYIAYCAVGAVYVIWLHRENIKRLIKGEENKVRE